LLGLRNGSHGAGEFGFPGGHLEYGESFEDCAVRETLEETGVEIENVRFLFLANVTKYAPKHYVHIGMVADWKAGEAQVMEEGREVDWKWYDLESVPEKLFYFAELSFVAWKEGRNYFDGE